MRSNKQQYNAFTGTPDAAFNTSKAAGIVGGVIGGLSNYSEGSSLVGSVAGAAIGAAAGYAFGDLMGCGDSKSVSVKILGGTMSALFGLSVGSIGTGLIDSVIKLGTDTPAE